ncbi:hypothetical protein K437DRAFT_11466 [Tilletiaria anomala UBC 951]|uniref:Uncharacterized protein n=1 Tax=Tilletiaria anomala (strain ATCC 24038 / CBS 436.72 / UBC 951) TaxID=1037660 RepID=A0A066VD75_TILAU|nr:uncharacterized protein K437DRAFT_11466 [Tilletiaria anomala UBC 951]KDN39381.1 hypothetical protein K437DRAFT_11466 [Tilletiaria anomala UBC 951]
MQFKSTFVILAAVAVNAVAAASGLAAPGTLPAYLDLQQKYFDGTASPDQIAQLTALGKKLHSQGVKLNKIVGTDTKGQHLFKMIGLNVGELLDPTTTEPTETTVNLRRQSVHATHEKPQQIGLVPEFLLAMNHVLSADGFSSDADVSKVLSLASKLLSHGTPVDRLAKMIGTDAAGLSLLSKIKDLPAAHKRNFVSDDVGEVAVDVKKLLPPPAKDANVPSGTIPQFQYYASTLWSDPLSAVNAGALDKLVALGREIRKHNPKALKLLLGDTAPAQTLLAQINGGAVKKRHMQKRGGAFRAIDESI